jgi:hypothetical protein
MVELTKGRVAVTKSISVLAPHLTLKRGDPIMKGLKLFWSVAVALMALGKTALASPIWNNAATTITTIDIEDTSDIPPGGNGVPRQFIYFKSAVAFGSSPGTLPPCSMISSGAWRIGGSPDNIKYLVSVANAAKLAGRSVLVLWNQNGQYQCDGGGTLGYPVIMGMQVQ